MTESTSARSRLGKDTAYFLAMLSVSACAALIGYGWAFCTFDGTYAFSFSFSNLYSDCHFPLEFLCRSALLCRPFLIEAVILLIISYSRFEKLLSFSYFLIRGVALGAALFITLRTSSVSLCLYLPLVHMAGTLLYLIFTRNLRTDTGLRSRSEAILSTTIAAGAASLLFAAAALLATIPI